MKRKTLFATAFLCLFGMTGSHAQNIQNNKNMEELKPTQEWDKTFPKPATSICTTTGRRFLSTR